jgi:hypothetical protein
MDLQKRKLIQERKSHDSKILAVDCGYGCLRIGKANTRMAERKYESVKLR